MIFLSPKLIALLFANICFLVSFVISLVNNTPVFDALVRAIALSVITYAIGYIFGFALKETFVEAIESWAKAEDEERAARLEAAKAAADEKKDEGKTKRDEKFKLEEKTLENVQTENETE